jgi:TetR/AcrR family transcriptional regulator, acrAB operon repressor
VSAETASVRPRRVDEIGEESRRRILDAAEELFADRG